MKEPSVSLCMIVKDEEKYLERCLLSVQPFVTSYINIVYLKILPLFDLSTPFMNYSNLIMAKP
ncbi:hypothetical protein [Bacillus sp. JJ722]|uniref:hypothetical protein n=1 Tax=Bacillus sp. JJ722 TaxID=3122973 RepID=UPI002FFD9EDA